MATIYPDYDAFLASAKWAALREVALQRDGFRCRICGSDRELNVHHRRYRSTWDATRVDDLTTLCGRCHDRHHHDLPAPPPLWRLPPAYRQPAAVAAIIVVGLVLARCALG